MAFVDEKTVLKFYLEQISNNNIEFLKGKDEAKNNISDEIKLLLEEENMHNKINIAKDLWKFLFEASMTYIDPDKRGYDDIFKYFDEYINFEELIFASDSFYRDHTMHCLWVYFLGEYLKKNDDYKGIWIDSFSQMKMATQDLDSAFRESKHSAIFEDVLYIFDIVNDVVANEDAIWCVSSLTHDLGYPIKKISKINKSIQKVLSYFQVNNHDEFNFNYGNVQQSFINDFIEFMCYGFEIYFSIDDEKEHAIEKISKNAIVWEDQKVRINDDGLDKLDEEEYKKLKEYMSDNTSIKIKMNFTKRLSFYNDFEHYEHGIMSAYLLMKTVYSFNTFKFRYNDYKDINPKDVDITKFISIYDILNAVANHTCFKFQIKSINDTSSFLIFIDEIEEFSRISRANQNRQYVEEFCKTDLSFVDGWFQIDFIFDNGDIEHLDPEFAFKGRCNKFLTLFDIHNLDDNLKIRLRCIDHVSDKNDIYCLEIARKYANIIVNNEEQNIPKYLKSSVFYTKEEYETL